MFYFPLAVQPHDLSGAADRILQDGLDRPVVKKKLTKKELMPFLSLLGATSLALVHLFAGRLRFLDVIPRSRWLSFASGISVAYVFVHLLPELGEAQEVLSRSTADVLDAMENHAYLIALAGITAFYGLERLAVASREESGEGSTSPGVFWIHIISFAAYNMLIGYVLGDREREPVEFWLFLIAIGLHFFVNDYGLRQHHKDMYQRVGRWVLAVAVLLGTGVGSILKIPEVVLLVPTAFLAGGIMLNVLKEELPEERQSRFGAFLTGVAAYSVLLLLA